MSNQIALRILSCIQIASKYIHCYEGLYVKTVMKFLREFGKCYSPDAILQSEMRILKTLNYKIGVASPLEYLETLLKLLYISDGSFDVNKYWEWCLVLLDTIFLHRREIYNGLLASAVGAPVECVTRSRVAYVESDYMLLTTGVICVASCCVDGIARAKELSQILQQITRVPSSDMCDLCVAVIQQVISVTRESNLTVGVRQRG